MNRFLIFTVVVLLPLSVHAQPDRGKMLYDSWCAQCHGYEGDANAYASGVYSQPQPRDFTLGTYKFRTTPSGDPPLDEDIVRSIRDGNPGTSMPPWPRFSDEEVDAMVEYIKGFAEETFEIEGEAFEIGAAPSPSETLLQRGKETYDKAKCWECHGRGGRGEGEKGWQEKFKNDWGTRAYPTDLTQSWEYRNGSNVEDIYRTVTSGFDGTPMASFQDSYDDEQRWALSHYVKSLQVSRNTGSAISARKVDALPSSTGDEQWNVVPYLDLPMGGQLIFEPRQFIPVITNMRVRGLYTDTEVAIMLEWTDKRPNKGDDGHPPDAVRLQFPVELSSGAEKPYFFLGDRGNAVTLWYWTASDDQVIELNAKGQEKDSLTRQENNNTTVSTSYTEGRYRVMFKRLLETKDRNDLIFTPGMFIPFSVTVFDGEHDEEGNRATISAWYYVVLEPETPIKVYTMPPLVAAAFVAAGISIRRKLKKDNKTK